MRKIIVFLLLLVGVVSCKEDVIVTEKFSRVVEEPYCWYEPETNIHHHALTQRVNKYFIVLSNKDTSEVSKEIYDDFKIGDIIMYE